jgi:hypothetical protein
VGQREAPLCFYFGSAQCSNPRIECKIQEQKHMRFQFQEAPIAWDENWTKIKAISTHAHTYIALPFGSFGMLEGVWGMFGTLALSNVIGLFKSN